MTSLQKAAAAVTISTSSKGLNSSCETAKGQFERCFASGLDLSEFGTTNGEGSDKPLQSAAAQLLRVKEGERRRKEQEEMADIRTREVVRERITDVRETLKLKRESNILVNALVQMHGSDTMDPSVFRKNKKLPKKLASVKHPVSSGPSKGTKMAHKKSRRSKY